MGSAARFVFCKLEAETKGFCLAAGRERRFFGLHVLSLSRRVRKEGNAGWVWGVINWMVFVLRASLWDVSEWFFFFGVRVGQTFV